MKLVMDRKKFETAYIAASSLTGSRDASVNRVRMQVETATCSVWLHAHDNERGGLIRVPAEAVKDCTQDATVDVFLPEDTRSILREASAEEITIFNGGGMSSWAKKKDDINPTITIQAGKAEYKFEELGDPTALVVKRFTAQEFFNVAADQFRAAIEGVQFACDTESSRFALGGALLELSASELTLVGTDGRRMSVRTIDRNSIAGDIKSKSTFLYRIQSARAINHVLKNDGEVSVAWDVNAIYLQQRDNHFYARQIEGRYPAWREVVPAKRDSVPFEIPAGVLFAAVRQASIACTKEHPGVSFSLQDNELNLKAETSDKGSTAIRLPVVYDGPHVYKCRLDHDYIRQFLGSVEESSLIRVDMHSAASSVVFSCDAAPAARYILMPLDGDGK